MITAVIIEPRNTKLLIYVIKNLLNKLKSIINKIHIFHGINNENIIRDNFNKYILNNTIILTNIKVKNLSIYEYSDLLTSISFWESIDDENILIFQIDSYICNYDKEFLIECMKYGFIGAPCRKWDIPWQNGGLSLRRKSLMIQAIKDKKINESTWPEDRFFTVIKRKIVNPAPFDLANKFSVEKYYYKKPFGIHKPWKYLTKEELYNLKNYNDISKYLCKYNI